MVYGFVLEPRVFAVRKGFTPTESVAIAEAVEPAVKAEAKKRQEEGSETRRQNRTGAAATVAVLTALTVVDTSSV